MTHALALLLGRVDYGEADLIVQLFTDGLGRVSALARGGRRSQKRFGGALEPFHTLQVALEPRTRGELFVLKDASIVQPRLAIAEDLARLEAAAEGLVWLRRATLPKNPERALFERAEGFLDALMHENETSKTELSSFGLGLLEILGFALNFGSCVSCGKECPSNRAAWIHPARGGLICVRCGGGPMRLSAALRARLVERTGPSDADRLSESEEALLLQIVERALSEHMGLGRSS